MKILVTGGAGFIGSHTVLSLIDNNFEPIIVDNFSNSVPKVLEIIEQLSDKKVPFYQIDCTDYNQLDTVFKTEKNIEGVIHFAAFKAVGESVAEPLKYYHNNVGSLIVLNQIMEKHKVKKLVFSSSCTVYGEPDLLPVTELTPTKKASSPYGYTKQICEQLITDLALSGSAQKNILLRYFNPIGAHPSGKLGELPLGVPNNLFPFITQTAAGLREKLTVFGNDYSTPDGTCIRDYIHVVDLAQAHVDALKFLEKTLDKISTFNVGIGKGISVKNAIETFEKVNNVKVNWAFGPKRPGDVEKIYADNQKIINDFNWKPKFGLEECCYHAWLWQLNLKNLNF